MIFDDLYYYFKNIFHFQKKSPIRNWTEEKETNFDFNEISKYFRYKLNKNVNFQYISEKTSNDIDLNFVFERIDRTYSSFGQQYLYNKIRTVKGKNSILNQKEILIEKIKKDSLNRNILIRQLNKISSKRDYGLIDLLNDEILLNKSGELYAIISLILLFTISFVSFFYLKSLLLLLPLTIFNIYYHYRNKAYQEYYREKLISLSKAISVGDKLSKNPLLKAEFEFNYIKCLVPLKKNLKFISFDSNYVTSDIFIVFWLIIELLRITFNFETIFFKTILKKIIKEKSNITTLYKDIGHIDTLLSIASLDLSEDFFSKPEFVSDKKMVITDMIHPLVENCVSNSINIMNGVILTGSNMSGKTTFIRAIAINALLSQTINRCFAKFYSCPYFKINTSIRIADDISENKSYFLEEVLTIKEFFKYEKDGHNLFILDEIFKGTNTKERIALGISIAKYLNHKNNFVFISTHYTEIATYLDKSMLNYNFSGNIINGNLTFSYILTKGILKTTNALDIITIYRYPQDVIKLSSNLLHY